MQKLATKQVSKPENNCSKTNTFVTMCFLSQCAPNQNFFSDSDNMNAFLDHQLFFLAGSPTFNVHAIKAIDDNQNMI